MEWYYNHPGTHATADYNQNLFIVPLLKKLMPTYHQISCVPSLTLALMISPYHIGELTPIPDHNTIVHTTSVNEIKHEVQA